MKLHVSERNIKIVHLLFTSCFWSFLTWCVCTHAYNYKTQIKKTYTSDPITEAIVLKLKIKIYGFNFFYRRGDQKVFNLNPIYKKSLTLKPFFVIIAMVIDWLSVAKFVRWTILFILLPIDYYRNDCVW